MAAALLISETEMEPGRAVTFGQADGLSQVADGFVRSPDDIHAVTGVRLNERGPGCEPGGALQWAHRIARLIEIQISGANRGEDLSVIWRKIGGAGEGGESFLGTAEAVGGAGKLKPGTEGSGIDFGGAARGLHALLLAAGGVGAGAHEEPGGKRIGLELCRLPKVWERGAEALPFCFHQADAEMREGHLRVQLAGALESGHCFGIAIEDESEGRAQRLGGCAFRITLRQLAGEADGALRIFRLHRLVNLLGERIAQDGIGLLQGALDGSFDELFGRRQLFQHALDRRIGRGVGRGGRGAEGGGEKNSEEAGGLHALSLSAAAIVSKREAVKVWPPPLLAAGTSVSEFGMRACRLILLVGILTCPVVLPANAASGPVFKVTSPSGKTHFLGGSIHALRGIDYPLPSGFNRAFEASSKIIFEGLPQDIERVPKEASKAGQLPKGDSLKNHLDPRTYDYLRRIFKLLGVPEATWSRYRAWFLAMMLQSMGSQGLSGELGIEGFLTRRARATKMPVEGLESLREGMATFSALNDRQAEALLLLTFMPGSEQSVGNDALVAGWKRGDTEFLWRQVHLGFRDYPALGRRVLEQRNRAWMPKIERYYSNAKPHFVVVGAAHLGGPEGLLRLLKARGYRIEQL